jgi:LysM repeat protein
MNAANPFQIPVCLQRADSQQRRRERFKRGFIAALAATVVLLVGLLIEGCMSEQSANTAPITPGTVVTVTDLPTTSVKQPSAVSPADSSPQPNPVATHKPVATVASENPAAASHSETLYVIKPGDTLTRIAKTHGTTVKALKAANSLENDRIVVGARLKIPDA